MVMEDEVDCVVYWWVGSHLERKGAQGSYVVNAAADMFCSEVMRDEGAVPTVPPLRPCRHRSMTFGAQSSDARWARDAWQQHIIYKHLLPAESESVRPVDCIDMLGAKGVRPFDKRMMLNARTGRMSLLGDRVDRAAEGDPWGFAAYVRGQECPCGGGAQTLRHVLRHCALPKMMERRERVITCMACIDDTGEHEQWKLALQEMRNPGTQTVDYFNRIIDEALLGVLEDGTEGAALRGRGEAAGRYVRAVTGLLAEGVRVAARVRGAARQAFERRQGLSRGMVAMRAEAMAATPREQVRLRECRREQAAVYQRVAGIGPALAEVSAGAAWCRMVRWRGRWRVQWEEGSVWLDGHMRLWCLALLVRRWLLAFRRRQLRGYEGLLNRMASDGPVGDEHRGRMERALRAGADTTSARLLWENALSRVYLLGIVMWWRRTVKTRGKRKGRGGGSGWGGKGKGKGGGKTKKRAKVAPPRDLKGKRRWAEVADFERHLERTERGCAGMLDDGNMVSGVPVPHWADRELRPGEWREQETGGEEEGRRGKRVRRGGLAGGVCRSRGERLYGLSWETGTVRTLWNAGGGRYQGAMAWAQERGRRVVRRLEEGADESGVT